MSHLQIATALGISKGVVTKYVGLAAAGLDAASLAELDEAGLERRLLAKPRPSEAYAQADYGRIDQELGRKGVTLKLLCEEYCAQTSDEHSATSRLQAQGIDASAATALQNAVASADIVSCATLATEPLMQDAWLRLGSYLDLIGSFTLSMREADDPCFNVGARLYVDKLEVLQKTGELLGPMLRDVCIAEDVVGALTDLVSGTAPGRKEETDRTVFKYVVGTGLDDLAAAVLVFEQTGRQII